MFGSSGHSGLTTDSKYKPRPRHRVRKRYRRRDSQGRYYAISMGWQTVSALSGEEKMNKGIFAALALVVSCFVTSGCIESASQSHCGDSDDNGENVEVAGNPFGVDGGTDGSGGSGGGNQSNLLGDGASCDVNEQCENDYCVPSKNSFGSGVCFSLAMEGCIVVTEPSPMHAQCSSALKQLYTCGENWTIETLGSDCSDVGTGEIGEHYHCCTKPSPI